MAFGKGAGGSENQIICLKYLIFFFNVLSWMMGAAIFALAAWIRFQDDFQEWVIEMQLTHYWNGIWVLFVAGLLVMFISFLGCCGAISENPFLISSYALCVGICFVLQLGGAAYVLDNGIEYSEFSEWAKDRFFDLIIKYDHDTRSRRIMNMIQEYIGCCGSRGPRDYDNLGKEIPHECQNPVTGNVYKDGCSEVFAWYMETKTGWIAGVALTLCLMQIFGIIFAICLCQALRRESRIKEHRGY